MRIFALLVNSKNRHRCVFLLLRFRPSRHTVMAMNDTLPTPQMIEDRATDAGLTMVDVYRMTGVAASTFQRWKQGRGSPSLQTVRKLIDATAGNERKE